MYRRTRKYTAQRLHAMQAGRDRARLAQPAPDYPEPLPDVRMRITVERFDPGSEGAHVFVLKRSRRIDMYRVYVDGAEWRVCGLSAVLEGLRKATPRRLSERSM